MLLRHVRFLQYNLLKMFLCYICKLSPLTSSIISVSFGTVLKVFLLSNISFSFMMKMFAVRCSVTIGFEASSFVVLKKISFWKFSSLMYWIEKQILTWPKSPRIEFGHYLSLCMQPYTFLNSFCTGLMSRIVINILSLPMPMIKLLWIHFNCSVEIFLWFED